MHAASIYLEIAGIDDNTRKALFACSVAPRMDDDAARIAIEEICKSNGNTSSLLDKIKRLDCIWHHWDGEWNISEDIRLYFIDKLSALISRKQLDSLRTSISNYFFKKAENISPDGQISLCRKRQALFESAHQRCLTTGQSKDGAELFVKIWAAAKDASLDVVKSVDYASCEMEKYGNALPVEILFFRGMAAHAKNDINGQLKYFKPVWKSGAYGRIYSIAAHFYGIVCKDRVEAETALRDSLKLYDDPLGHAKVHNSLGNLLSKDRSGKRWIDAKNEFEKSLELDRNHEHQGQVYHSLGNLYSKYQDSDHRKKAEAAYKRSIALRSNPQDKALVYLSLGNLLSRDRSGKRWKDAEDAFNSSLKLDDRPEGKGKIYHSLGNLLSKYKNRKRWDEAEAAYKKSIDLLNRAEDKAKVKASWANALYNLFKEQQSDKIIALASDALATCKSDLRTCSACHNALSNTYLSMGDKEKALEHLKALLINDKKIGNSRFIAKTQNKIDALKSYGNSIHNS